MGAISALSTTGRALKRNGVLVAAAFVVSLVSLVPTGVTAFVPPESAAIVSLLISAMFLFATPFFMGGLLSMADEALDGTTQFGTFVSGGTDNYLRLFGAMLLFGVAFAVVGFAFLVVAAVVSVFALGTATGGAGQSLAQSGGNIALLVLFALVAALLFMVPIFVFQFYAAAVVVSDLGIVDSFKRSAAVVRRNLVSTLGYVVVAVAVGLFSGVASSAVSLVSELGGGATAVDVSVGVVVLVAVVAALITSVVSAFGVVYQVAFYDDCLDALA